MKIKQINLQRKTDFYLNKTCFERYFDIEKVNVTRHNYKHFLMQRIPATKHEVS